MAFFYDLKGAAKKKKRIADRLLKLKARLASEVPKRNLEESLLIATWNIREFDSNKCGARGEEPLSYIAEIISHFDIVAIQEVRKDLKALNDVKAKLGKWWDFLVTDVTEGTKGNNERMAYLYDKRKIRFGGFVGEVVIPPKAGGPSEQLYRTPFMAGFESAWFKFIICTAHIVYGKATANSVKRVEEVKRLAGFLAQRAKSESKNVWSNNFILLGDFNIFHRDTKTYKAITEAGFKIPKELQDVPASNVGKEKRFYDQIAIHSKKNQLLAKSAGVFDFFESVYREDEESLYVPDMGEAYYKTSKGKPRSEKAKARYYKTNWRTHQMSDHLLMWMELKTDFGSAYLESIK